jgi:hypothetical protein
MMPSNAGPDVVADANEPTYQERVCANEPEPLSNYSGADMGVNHSYSTAYLTCGQWFVVPPKPPLVATGELYSFAAMNRLMGFEEIWKFDRDHATD